MSLVIADITWHIGFSLAKSDDVITSATFLTKSARYCMVMSSFQSIFFEKIRFNHNNNRKRPNKKYVYIQKNMSFAMNKGEEVLLTKSHYYSYYY